MEVALEQADKFIANNGLAIFLVVALLFTGIYAMWRPPAWIARWLMKKEEVAERHAIAHEIIAESTRTMSETNREIRETMDQHGKELEKIRVDVGKTSTWIGDMGEMIKEAVRKQLDHHDVKGGE